MRRRNHIARDLGTPKYRPRVVRAKEVEPDDIHMNNWIDENDTGLVSFNDTTE